MTQSELHQQLLNLFEDDNNRVSTEAEILKTHSIDKWHASSPPDVVVFAESAEDVSKTLKFANENGIPVTTRGAGVGYVGGCVPVNAGIVLSVARMNEIIEINPEDGVAVVQPGVITGQLQAAVKELGWYYPPDPASLKECSIGGNVATNAGGPKCLKYGVTRNYVLGLEVVLASGEILRTGGRTHKNKTGFDLIGMFVGSEGLLGVVTEVTLRIIPHPPARITFSAGFETFESAAAAVQKILGAGFLPCALEISDRFTLQAARDYPDNPANVPPGEAHLLFEIDGSSDAVHADKPQLLSLLDSFRPTRVETAETEAKCDEIWEIRRSFSYSLKATGLIKLNEDIVVPRGKLVDLAHFSGQLQQEFGYAVASFGHAGDGNIHVNIMVEQRELDENRERVDAALDRLFHQVLDWGGVITGEHGVGIAKKRWFGDAISPVSHKVHVSLKQALDPNGILNPGKFVPFEELA
ncbi:MAG: FAD-linked oxidase C-terminal domain-containing protein [Verrucomicrobiota bacterium]